MLGPSVNQRIPEKNLLSPDGRNLFLGVGRFNFGSIEPFTIGNFIPSQEDATTQRGN